MTPRHDPREYGNKDARGSAPYAVARGSAPYSVAHLSNVVRR